MAKYNITKIATDVETDVESWERDFRKRWSEEAKEKNDRIIGDGYADRQIADTLSKVAPIDVRVSKVGKNMDELVRRGSVVEALADHFEGDRDAWRELFAEFLEDVPGIKPKRGSWKRDTWRERFAPGLHYFVCSCCSTVNDSRPKYCPNCGAFMRGKK